MLAVGFLAWYLFVLFDRTGWLNGGTSIGMDVIYYYHILSASVVALNVILLKNEVKNSKYLIVTGFIIWSCFFFMNFFGFVWEIQKGEPVGIFEIIKSKT